MVMDIARAVPDLPSLKVWDFLTGGGSGGGSERKRLEDKARAVARQYGIPEEAFIQHIASESGWKVDALNAASGASGLGQFLPDTARAYGTTPEELRRNPDLALELAGRLLRDNYDMLDQDWTKAFAAYFVGPQNVLDAIKAGGANWLRALDGIAQQYGQGTVSDYLAQRGLSGGGRAPQVYSGDQGQARDRQNVSLPEPQLEDYRIVIGEDPFGNPIYGEGYDYQLYAANRKAWEELTNPEPAISKYMEDAAASIAAEIESGRLKLDQATREFNRRMDAYTTASTRFDSLLGYAVPAGATTYPSAIPGVNAERPIGQSFSVNPFEDVLNILNETPSPMDVALPDLSPRSIMDRAAEFEEAYRSPYGRAPMMPSSRITAPQFAGAGGLITQPPPTTDPSAYGPHSPGFIDMPPEAIAAQFAAGGGAPAITGFTPVGRAVLRTVMGG